jgi:glycine oxidase
VVGAEASSAAGGILGAQIEGSALPAETLDRLIAARDAYPAWVQSLEALTGLSVGYRRCGSLHLSFDEPDAAHARAQVRAQAARGLAAEWLDPAGLRSCEPHAAEQALGAAFFASDAQVDPQALLRALVVALGKQDVSVRSGSVVEELVFEGERCVGVQTNDALLRADAVILAAGSWSSTVRGVPISLPKVKPVRGQMVLLEERPPRLSRVVFGAGGYVVPRGDGRVLAGSTMEHVGHRREITAGGVRDIMNAALRVAPCLEQAEWKSAWCNFRPWVGDEAPLVGASGVPGLFLATGHHRNGILLARHTAVAVASSVMRAQG